MPEQTESLRYGRLKVCATFRAETVRAHSALHAKQFKIVNVATNEEPAGMGG